MPRIARKQHARVRKPVKVVVSGGGAYRKRKARGSGAYTLDDGPFANAGAFVGRTLGKAGFGRTAGDLGEWLGRRLFHYPAKLFGSGSYDQVNGSVEHFAPQVPAFSNASADDACVITHREYIGDIISSSTAGAFKVQGFTINPGDAVTFPWLSTLCSENFQQYKFDGCIFEYRATSGNALNSTNTALGSVFAAVNYDFGDNAPTSRMQLENYSWASNCKPSENMNVFIECKKSMTSQGGLLFIQNDSNIPAGSDPKTYHLGKLYIATTGCQGTSVNLGSLYVTYKVRLLKPFMNLPGSNAMMSLALRGAPTGVYPFGTNLNSVGVPQNCDSIGIRYDNSSNYIEFVPNQRTLVGQKFLIVYRMYGSASASFTAPTLSFTGGISAVSNTFMTGAGVGYSASNFTFPASSVTTQSWGFVQMVQVDDPTVSGKLVCTGGVIPSGTTQCQVNIYQVCPSNPSRLGVIQNVSDLDGDPSTNL